MPVRVTSFIKRLPVIVLAVVFGWSGIIKLLDPEGFALAVYRQHLLPHNAVNAVSLWIIWIEISCTVVLLFIPRLRGAALWLVMGLLIAFSFGIGLNLVRGSHMACGCFSTSPLASSMNWLGLLKNVALIALAAFALILPSNKSAPRRDEVSRL